MTSAAPLSRREVKDIVKADQAILKTLHRMSVLRELARAEEQAPVRCAVQSGAASARKAAFITAATMTVFSLYAALTTNPTLYSLTQPLAQISSQYAGTLVGKMPFVAAATAMMTANIGICTFIGETFEGYRSAGKEVKRLVRSIRKARQKRAQAIAGARARMGADAPSDRAVLTMARQESAKKDKVYGSYFETMKRAPHYGESSLMTPRLLRWAYARVHRLVA